MHVYQGIFFIIMAMMQGMFLWGAAPDDNAVYDNGEDEEVENVQDLLDQGACFMDFDTVARAILLGANVNHINPLTGNTPLHRLFVLKTYCCEKERNAILELLLTKDALVNQQNDGGQTPLHCACNCYDSEAVGHLLQAGADPLLTDQWEHRPLYYVFDGLSSIVPQFRSSAFSTLCRLMQLPPQLLGFNTDKWHFEGDGKDIIKLAAQMLCVHNTTPLLAMSDRLPVEQYRQLDWPQKKKIRRDIIIDDVESRTRWSIVCYVGNLLRTHKTLKAVLENIELRELPCFLRSKILDRLALCLHQQTTDAVAFLTQHFKLETLKTMSLRDIRKGLCQKDNQWIAKLVKKKRQK